MEVLKNQDDRASEGGSGAVLLLHSPDSYEVTAGRDERA